MKYIRRYVSIILISLTLYQCGLFKKNQEKNVSKFSKELIEGITKNYYIGSALKILGKIKYEDANTNIAANFKSFWKPDSIYYASFSLFGIEGAKMLINKKQIKLLNRMQKKAYVFNVQEILAKYGIPLNYNEFEKIILGEFPEKWISKSNIKTNSNGYLITGSYNNVIYKTEISNQTFHINYIQLKYQKYSAEIKYMEYKPFNDHLFPTKINIEVSGPRDVSIEVNINKFVSLKNIPTLKFNIPKGYEVISTIK